MADVFDDLANMLNALPEQIKTAYEEATIEAIDSAADKFESDLRRMSGSNSLNATMETSVTHIPHEYYERAVDWNDQKIVNVDKGKNYGRDRTKPRASRKRNFSLRPATYHDLAYIINFGHSNGKTFIAGNHFIDRAKRRIKWKQEQEKLFTEKLDDLTNKE